MGNTFAINTTRNREFQVEQELLAMGLHPWVPKRRDSRYVKEKRAAVWYDRPYVPKLIFCVIPAVYWPDVYGLKNVIGKPFALSAMDIRGVEAHTKHDGRKVPATPGLIQFKSAVAAEYEDCCRLEKNSNYQCKYHPGQALEVLDGPFEGFRAEFKKVIKRAHDEYSRLSLCVDIFGRETPIEIDPDRGQEL